MHLHPIVYPEGYFGHSLGEAPLGQILKGGINYGGLGEAPLGDIA